MAGTPEKITNPQASLATEPDFSISQEELGPGSTNWWHDENMLGKAREKVRSGEYLGVFRARGYVFEDVGGRTFLSEVKTGGGNSLEMYDILPGSSLLGGELEVEIIVRAKEIENS